MTTDIFVIITLVVIVLLQAGERYFFADQVQKEKEKLLDEMSRLVKAVISKNANDYVMTTSIDKVAPEPKAEENPDLIPEESLSDEEFMESISKQNKK